MPSNHLILCHPLLLPSIFANIRAFSKETDLHIRWINYWSFSFIISPSNEYSGLISFRIDQLDLLAAEGLSRVFYNTTIQKHQFFGDQLSLQSNSHIPYMTTGKTIALTRWTFAGKVMSVLFNMLSGLVMAFLPRSKCLNFMAAVTIYSDFGAQANSLSLFNKAILYNNLNQSKQFQDPTELTQNTNR